MTMTTTSTMAPPLAVMLRDAIDADYAGTIAILRSLARRRLTRRHAGPVARILDGLEGWASDDSDGDVLLAHHDDRAHQVSWPDPTGGAWVAPATSSGLRYVSRRWTPRGAICRVLREEDTDA